MLYAELTCPIHCGPLVSVEEKPEYKCKCVWKECHMGVISGDESNRIIDPRYEEVAR